MSTSPLPSPRPRGFRLAAPQYRAAITLAACGGGDDEVDPLEQPQAVSAATCLSRPNDNFSKLQDCVTLAGVRAHQQAFQTGRDARSIAIAFAIVAGSRDTV